MNTTAITILKMLFQSPMTDEDISKYLTIEKTGIYKNICLINEMLERNNFKKIEKNDKEYCINLTSQERKRFYETINIMSLDEKIDYLYVKLINNGILNLEEERVILDVSRSTIIRTFKEVKEILEKNGSKIEYSHGKGMQIVKVSQEEKKEFCIKIMKFLMLEGYYSNPLKTFVENLKSRDIERRFIKINEIFKENEILFNFPSFFFCYAMEIGTDKFGEFNLFETSIRSEKCNLIENEDDFTLEYKHMLNELVYRLKIKEDWTYKATIDRIRNLYLEILKKIGLKDLEAKYREMLIYNIYIGLFKKENKILKIKKINMKNNDEILIKEIGELIHNLGVDLYYSDLLMVIQIIKKIIIDARLEKAKILILINELTTNHYQKLLQDLRKKYSKSEIKLDAFYLCKINGIKNFSEYDLVISEEDVDIENFRKTNINLFSMSEIQSVIDSYAIEKTFSSF